MSACPPCRKTKAKHCLAQIPPCEYTGVGTTRRAGRGWRPCETHCASVQTAAIPVRGCTEPTKQGYAGGLTFCIPGLCTWRLRKAQEAPAASQPHRPRVPAHRDCGTYQLPSLLWYRDGVDNVDPPGRQGASGSKDTADTPPAPSFPLCPVQNCLAPPTPSWWSAVHRLGSGRGSTAGRDW